jgi:hypothetical protein
MLARAAVLALLAVWLPAAAPAKIVNVELKFTPYVGDAGKSDAVESVAGVATIFVNGMPYGEQPVQKERVPVLFDERELAPSVWIPIESLGPIVRKGKNTVRVEFTPVDESVEYTARLAWASVTDEENRAGDDGKTTATNQTGAGHSEKSGKGKLVLEHQLDADFAPDLPWHHYPSVTEVGEADASKLTALVVKRGDAFRPDFAKVYDVLAGNPRIDVAKIQEAKCVDAAYAAGVRIDAPKPDDLAFVTTGHPEVVIRRKTGKLFLPKNPEAFGNIEGDEMQMCAGIALSLAFPPQLVVVREPTGSWKVVY